MMNLDIENEKVIIKKDKQDIECRVLFTFSSTDTMKLYIGYTDDSIGSNGRKNIYVSNYSPFSLENKLENVTESKELEMINKVLERIDYESNK